MRGALILFVAAGIGLGWLLPARAPRERPAPEARPAKEAQVAVAARRDMPVETLLERRGDGHFYARAEVNGQQVDFLVDTGASMVALTTEDARRVGLVFSEDEFEVIGTGASGPVRGKMLMLGSVAIDGKRLNDVPGAVVEGLQVSLLGQAYLTRMGLVEMNGDRMRIR